MESCSAEDRSPLWNLKNKNNTTIQLSDGVYEVLYVWSAGSEQVKVNFNGIRYPFYFCNAVLNILFQILRRAWISSWTIDWMA